VVDKRRHPRKPVDIPVEFAERGSATRTPGRAKDISIGGVSIESASPLAFSTEIDIYLSFGPRQVPLLLGGVVRWTSGTCMGVQFALLGARETYAVTEIARE
jgi:type IV pilus assembly protein PilZ